MAGRPWSDEELALLEDMAGTYTVATIAKRLGRSFDAVNIKMNRIGVCGFEKSTDLLTMNQLCIMFGLQSRTVKKKWRNKGLRIMRKGNYLTVKQQDIIRYLKEHPEDWNATRITDDSLIMAYPWYKEKRRMDTNDCYFWTSENISRLNYLRHEGYSIREIAEDMGRSESSIKYKLYSKKQEETRMTLDEKIREYKDILDKKEDLAAQTKENNAAKEKLEQEICKMMVDEEKPSTVVDGFNYSLSQKVMYSKKSEEDLAALQAETGSSFFDVLREQGLGDIIKEVVDPRTLQSTVSGMAAELEESDEELPEDLKNCLNIYEKLSISKRKANTKALERAKANKEGK